MKELFVRGQLSNLIRNVQKELVESQEIREADGLSPIFEFDSLELELNFVTSQTSDDKAGIDIKLISASLGDSYKSEQVHKLKLRLNKSDTKNDSSFEIPGGAFPMKEGDDT